MIATTGLSSSPTFFKAATPDGISVLPALSSNQDTTSSEGRMAANSPEEETDIGLCRNEETHQPEEYYCKLPDIIEERQIVVVDPMLATGGSAIAAINFIKQHGGKNIKFLCIIAAPEGVRVLHRSHPDVQIYVGHLDRELNEDAYICPGLGDAGDRIFGTR